MISRKQTLAAAGASSASLKIRECDSTYSLASKEKKEPKISKANTYNLQYLQYQLKHLQNA